METAKSSFMTFVLRITDKAAARSTIDPLMEAFRDNAELPGIEVTAVSMDDEMSNAEILEAQLIAVADRAS